MKWQEITESTPRDTDLLFRIETDKGEVMFEVGDIFEESLYLHGDACLRNEYGFVCNIAYINAEFKSVKYIDPREIV